MGAKVKCLKCYDIIESLYRHDFKVCSCGGLFIDGGDDYTRFGGTCVTNKLFEWITDESDGE